MKGKNLIYDGSFEGFLSAVFYVFEYKLEEVTIQRKQLVQEDLFHKNEAIITDTNKSKRVWKGIIVYVTKTGAKLIYKAFLSEQKDIENLLLDYIQHIFKTKKDVSRDFTHESVLKVAQIERMVGREKHRMEAFVRFRLTKDQIYFASIEPDFNVLPLISKHFEKRYADQKWVVYDIKRKYGLYYDLNNVTIIEIEFPKNFNFTKTEDTFFASEEFEFQKLWKDYFKSTNIASRKNTKLHKQHVPRRYWKYLSEKQL